MPAPIDRPALPALRNLGSPKPGLAPIPGRDAGPAELRRALEESWPMILRGRTAEISKAEASYLVRLAQHPGADAGFLADLKEKAAGVRLARGAEEVGFGAFLAALPGRQPAIELPPAGPVVRPPEPGRPEDGNRVVDNMGVRDFNRPPPASRYQIDLEGAGRVFRTQFGRLSDLFSSKTPLPNGHAIVAPSHMLGQKEADLRLIAYDDNLGPAQKDIARFVAPGEIAIAIKHHSAKPDNEEKERMKLQCTHIGIVVGVKTDDGPGAITINNPQSYQRGLFGTPDYPMIFVKPTFPDGVTNEQKHQYIANIRTWMMIANTFTEFPPDYNGGDPLATRSVGQVKELGDKLLAALAGDEEAKAWLQDPAHHVYCAELAHVVLNLGLHYPLNKASLGEARFAEVKAALNAGEFLRENGNPYAELVDLQMAPATLKPISALLGIETTEPGQKPFGQGLAMQPFTVADILEKFLQTTIPREQMGEALAPVQGEILRQARAGLFEATGIDQLAPEDPKRAAVEQLYDQLIGVVAQPHGSYGEFRAALAPLLLAARQVANPRGDGKGAFVPPSAFLSRATEAIEGRPTQGLLGWQYVGHGMHPSTLKPAE